MKNRKCRRVLSHVHSTVPKMCVGESWVGYRKRTAHSLRIKQRKMGSADDNRKIVDEIWTTMIWVVCDGEVYGHEGPSFCSWWRITSWWRSRSAWIIKKGPGERDKMEAQMEVSQQRSAGRHSTVGREKGRTGYSFWHKAPHGGCDGPACSR